MSLVPIRVLSQDQKKNGTYEAGNKANSSTIHEKNTAPAKHKTDLDGWKSISKYSSNSSKMGFFERETQRQVRERKENFGVECFDMLRATSQKSRMKMFLHQIEVSGAEAYMECEQDVAAMEREKAGKLDKLTALVVDGFSRGDEAEQPLVEKFETEVVDIEERIRARKEQFGIVFFDAICFPSGNDSRHMKIHNAKERVFFLHSSSKDVVLQNCIAGAKRDVWVMENRQQLVSEGRLAEI